MLTLNHLTGFGVGAAAVASGPVAATWWRLRATADTYNTAVGGKTLDIYEIQYFTSADGSGTPLTVAAVAASSANGGYVAANAVDGNTATDWETLEHQSGYQWIAARFATAQVLRTVKIWPGGPANNAYIFSQGVVEYSQDGADWAQLATITPANLGGQYQTCIVQ
jgi:hypothetical protein